uniref:protein phosphatase 1 regulatory subunit 3C-B-like n=1 Tax=Myxine glutinosa TaxID=7769 RepID=UPI00358E470E
MNCTRVLPWLFPSAQYGHATQDMMAFTPNTFHSKSSFLFGVPSSPPSPLAHFITRHRPLRPCLINDGLVGYDKNHGSVKNGTQRSATARKTTSKMRSRQPRKSVVFADTQGLPLINIRYYREADDPCPDLLQFEMLHLDESFVASLKSSSASDSDSETNVGDCFELASVLPLSGSPTFSNCLSENCVCLETCAVQSGYLWGRVAVSNISFEKHVFARVSFDGWASFTDVEACYTSSRSDASKADTFEFFMILPWWFKDAAADGDKLQKLSTVELHGKVAEGNGQRVALDASRAQLKSTSELRKKDSRGDIWHLLPLKRKEGATPCLRIEFCLCFESQDATHWDNNNGRNYMLISTTKHKTHGSPNQAKAPLWERCKGNMMESDPFGSPRNGQGHFLGLQNWGVNPGESPYW